MSSNLLQISSQFTEDCIATSASPCERLECTTVIQPGEKRFYVAPHGRPDKPGKHICEPCMVYYLNKLSTTARVVPTVQTIYYLGRAMLTRHLKLLPFNISAIIIANGFSLKYCVISSAILSVPKA
jgi:hypothetical protein